MNRDIVRLEAESWKFQADHRCQMFINMATAAASSQGRFIHIAIATPKVTKSGGILCFSINDIIMYKPKNSCMSISM